MASRAKSDSVQLKLRMKEPLRAALEAAATERGVSMNNEMIERLTRSFEDETKLELHFDRRYLHAILGIVAGAMDHAGSSTAAIASRFFSQEAAGHWLSSPIAYDQAVKAALTVLEAFRPHGEVPALPAAIANLGDEFAKGMIEEIIADPPTMWGETEIPPRTHRDLGHLLARLSKNVESKS